MVKQVKLDDWCHFKKAVSELLHQGLAGHPPDEFIFRCQSLGSYDLSASLDREHPSTDVGSRNRLQDRMCTYFRHRNPELTESLTDEQVVALLQHSGAPTRFLDWTTSPYVAAFFAASDTLRETSDQEYCAVWVLWRNAPPLRAGAGASVIEPSFMSNARSRAQRGLFTTNNSLSSTLRQFIEDFDGAKSGGAESLWQWLLPRRDALHARRDLRLMGIDHEGLFPDVTGAAKAAYHLALEGM